MKVKWKKKAETKKQVETKKNKYRLPTEQRRILVKRSLWVVVIGVFSLMIFFVLRSTGYALKQSKQQRQIEAIEQTVQKMTEDSKITDNLDVFCRQFISAYYATNQASEDAYKKLLTPFFAKGIELPKLAPKKSEKKLVSVQLWKKEAHDDQKFSVSYMVSYTYESDGKKSNGKELVHFAVSQKEATYSVITAPYFESVPQLVNDAAEKQVLRKKDLKRLTEEEQKEYEEWLDATFFPKYFSDTPIEEMKYMMEEPKVLGNVRLFDGLKTCDAYQDGNNVFVYTVVQIKDPITQAKQEQELGLVIMKQKEKTYKVTELKNYAF